jgi:type IV pilus assembly protein PilC
MAKKIQRSAPRAAEPRPATDVPPRPTHPSRRAAGAGASRPVVTDFTIQLATLTEAGIPIVKALTILEGQSGRARSRPCCRSSSRTSLGHAALGGDGEAPRAFDRLYTSMVRAGEAGGVLGTVLERQARFQESADDQRQGRSAMIYPSVIVARRGRS